MGAPTQSLGQLLGSKGGLLIDDTSAHTDEGYGVLAREDTVISAWTAEDFDGRNDLDLVSKFGLSGKAIKSTDPALVIPSGYWNKSITLSSGSIYLLRGRG